MFDSNLFYRHQTDKLYPCEGILTQNINTDKMPLSDFVQRAKNSAIAALKIKDNITEMLMLN